MMLTHYEFGASPARIVSSETPSVVSDTPLIGEVSGYTTPPIFAQEPVWMCAGCVMPAGAPVRASSTSVLPSIAVSVAVPFIPELFWALKATTTDCDAGPWFMNQ